MKITVIRDDVPVLRIVQHVQVVPDVVIVEREELVVYVVETRREEISQN